MTYFNLKNDNGVQVDYKRTCNYTKCTRETGDGQKLASETHLPQSTHTEGTETHYLRPISNDLLKHFTNFYQMRSADLSRTVVSYMRQCGHEVLINR